MHEAVGNGGNREEHRGKERERRPQCTESRRDLPVCFRCGKRRLPVDSIRASSGYHVKGGGVRKGKNKKKGGNIRCKKEKGRQKDKERIEGMQKRKTGWGYRRVQPAAWTHF